MIEPDLSEDDLKSLTEYVELLIEIDKEQKVNKLSTTLIVDRFYLDEDDATITNEEGEVISSPSE